MEGSELPAEATLLAEALDVSPAQLAMHSREPLGDGSVVGIDVRAPGEEADLLYFVDTSGLRVRVETGMLRGTPESPEARIWLHPADPHLPALAPVAFDHAAESLLARLGLTAQEAPAFVAYRPGRRGVLRVRTDAGTVWLKVVRPSRIERTVEAHAALAAAGVPGPAVLGWSAEGLIVLETASGTPATDVEWWTEALLDEVDRLRDRIRGASLPRPVRGVAVRQDWYERLASGLPGAVGLSDRIRAVMPAPDAEVVAVHGDLHFGQLFLAEDGTISAVIDADTAGTGLPAEDAAAFIAHAIASALLTSQPNDARVWALADAAQTRWDEEPGVRALTATHLVGHAIGASDAGDPVRAQTLLGVARTVLDGGAPSQGRVVTDS